MMVVKNSSGKITGQIEFENNKYYITNGNKPQLILEDTELIEAIQQKDETIFPYLYDEIQLTIGEIAALYGTNYTNINKRLKQYPLTTNASTGRRNSSYGATFSQTRRENIGKAGKGKHNNKPYEMTEEIKNKISQGVKEYYSTHTVSEETRRKLSQAWIDGKYSQASMGRGINGTFFSNKNKTKIFFRSMLELFYCLSLEEDVTIKQYKMEPFQIPIDKNHHYTPDILINNQKLIELKSFRYVNKVEDKTRFQLEQEAAMKYCFKNSLTYQIVYDIDLGYNTKEFKRYLKANPLIIEKYQIKFSNPNILTSWS